MKELFAEPACCAAAGSGAPKLECSAGAAPDAAASAAAGATSPSSAAAAALDTLAFLGARSAFGGLSDAFRFAWPSRQPEISRPPGSKPKQAAA